MQMRKESLEFEDTSMETFKTEKQIDKKVLRGRENPITVRQYKKCAIHVMGIAEEKER